MTSRFSKETISNGVEMFKTGKYTMQEVADVSLCSRECVRRWVHADPVVKKLRKTAWEMRKAGKTCSEIIAYSEKHFFPVAWQIISTWTRDVAGDTYRETQAQYHEKKAKPGWALLLKWRLPPNLGIHLKEVRLRKLEDRILDPRTAQKYRLARCA